MGRTEIFSCDVCKQSMDKDCLHLSETIQAVFTTEQTEGRPRSPYLSTQKVDICVECLDYIIKNHPLKASGAMGYNTYYKQGK